MSSRLHLALSLALLTLSLGCGDKDTGGSSTGDGSGSGSGTDDTGIDGDDTGSSGTEDCDGEYDLTWNNWGSSFFATYCDSCHAASSPNRFGAPEYATFDTEDEVRNWAQAIRLSVLEDESMPLGGGVYEDNLFLLEIYLDCGL